MGKAVTEVAREGTSKGHLPALLSELPPMVMMAGFSSRCRHLAGTWKMSRPGRFWLIGQ
jgi:hypothetical protein